MDARTQIVKQEILDASRVAYIEELEARIKELEAEVERLKAMTYLPSNEAIDKAAKYDALRERFPFLPGEEFWSFFQGSICKWTVDKIWFNFDDNLCLIGYRERPGNTALESPKYLASECYHTADACRAAIPVEE